MQPTLRVPPTLRVGLSLAIKFRNASLAKDGEANYIWGTTKQNCVKPEL